MSAKKQKKRNKESNSCRETLPSLSVGGGKRHDSICLTQLELSPVLSHRHFFHKDLRLKKIFYLFSSKHQPSNKHLFLLSSTIQL